MASKSRSVPQPRHFLDLDALDAKTLRGIIDMAHAMKKAGKETPAKFRPGIAGSTLAMIFEKPSTRTRVSFDVAMRQLGGQTLSLNNNDLQLGRGESIADTARVLSRYVDAIMIRANAHEHCSNSAEYATVPVINGLTDKSHPCQVMADIMTFEEQRADKGQRWPGSATATTSPSRGCTPPCASASSCALPVPRSCAGQERHRLGQAREGRCHVSPTTPRRPCAARLRRHRYVGVDGPDGCAAPQEDARAIRRRCALMSQGGQGRHLHALPPRLPRQGGDRGRHRRAAVGVFDEAENRLHAQKAILAWCLSGS